MPEDQQHAAVTASHSESRYSQAASQSTRTKPHKVVGFNAGTQYQVLDVVSDGAYDVVCSAVHRPSGCKVAIKKITPPNHSMFYLRTLRELRLLKFLSGVGTGEGSCENIISILDIIKPPSFEAFKEVYLVQELMETDLHHVIRTQDLSDDHAQYFIYQTLRALKVLHSAGVIHRNLRPSNLLVNANCDLKICDFSLARSIEIAAPSGTEIGFMTEYVAMRWYSAPEIMLAFNQYTKAADIWSVGCILAEIFSGKPLFPGRDYHHQLELVFDIIGRPTLEEYYSITSHRIRQYVFHLPPRRQRLSQLFPDVNPLGVHFLQMCLTFDPKKRMTVEEALAHPYLEAYHEPDDEPVAPPLGPGFFAYELHKDYISREQFRELLYDEIVAFNPAPIT